MSKPQVFTREDIVACADEVIGMSGGYNGAFVDGVLALAGYLLDMTPEEVFEEMNGNHLAE